MNKIIVFISLWLFLILIAAHAEEAYNSPNVKLPISVRVPKEDKRPEANEFVPHLLEFRRLYKKYTGESIHLEKLTIFFGDPASVGGFDPNSVIEGTCSVFEGHGSVIIRKAGWDNKTSFVQKFVVFHELGHCLCNLKHEDVGIMRAVGEDPRAFEEDYLRYFFKSCQLSRGGSQ